MTLNFPNRARSYDATRRRVRFWGHDSALEISFFVDADALVEPTVPDGTDDETMVLRAFDDSLERIHEVANTAYKRGAGFTFTLTAEDF